MILILEERKPIEPNHLVRDAAFAELVRDGFGDHHYDLLTMREGVSWFGDGEGEERKREGRVEKTNHRRQDVG